MEKTTQGILTEIFFMRKLICYLSAFAIAGLVSTNIHSQEPFPPPPPPAPPEDVAMTQAGPGVPSDKFYENNPSVSKAYWMENKKIVIELKDGTKKKYNIDNEKEKKDFLNKFGALPFLPPPPPPLPSPPPPPPVRI